MGIKGLWHALKPYVQDGHLGQFRGQRVAVDMYVWLHMATRDCIVVNEERLAAYFLQKQSHPVPANDAAAAEEAVPGVAVEDVVTLGDAYIEKVVQRVETLQRYGVAPVCVFDGADIPMKRGTHEERGELREQCFRKALEQLEANYFSCGGRGFQRYAATYKAALELLERAVDISTEVAHPVIQVLREERHLECIVAPYEADAQLAYLAQTGYVHAALSEDSDLIAYYCPCVIAKLDFSTGRCAVLLPAQSVPTFFLAMSEAGLGKRGGQAGGGGITTLSTPSAVTSTLSSSGFASLPTHAATASGRPSSAPSAFTYESFLLGCVMSGCDYAKNLNKIGIKTAFKLVTHAQSLPELLSLLQTQFGFPAETVQRYRREILRAFYCFAHHIVYCPVKKKMVNLHPLPAHAGAPTTLKTELVGTLWPDDVARKVCEECLYDPATLHLYLGTFRPALQSYLQRTRRGQASLTSFKGFSEMRSAKVVVQGAGGVKREHETTADACAVPHAHTGSSSGLQRVGLAHGFLGAGASGHVARRVVRSKYFLHSDGRQGVREDWSPSDSEEGEKEAEASRRNVDSSGSSSTEQSASTDTLTAATVATTAISPPSATAPVIQPGAALANGSLRHGLATPALSELTLGTESPPALPDSVDASPPQGGSGGGARAANSSPASPTCLCPFRYTQCNTAHSIFFKCFEGKSWTRGGGVVDGVAEGRGGETGRRDSPVSGRGAGAAGSPSAASSPRGSAVTAGAPPDDDSPQPPVKQRILALPSTNTQAATTYQCAGFKPPRSLAHKEKRKEEEEEQTMPAPSTKMAKLDRAAASSIFDRLAFKKA